VQVARALSCCAPPPARFLLGPQVIGTTFGGRGEAAQPQSGHSRSLPKSRPEIFGWVTWRRRPRWFHPVKLFRILAVGLRDSECGAPVTCWVGALRSGRSFRSRNPAGLSLLRPARCAGLSRQERHAPPASVAAGLPERLARVSCHLMGLGELVPARGRGMHPRLWRPVSSWQEPPRCAIVSRRPDSFWWFRAAMFSLASGRATPKPHSDLHRLASATSSVVLGGFASSTAIPNWL
jgi:hypothetical protein